MRVGSPGPVPPVANNVPDDALTNRNLTSAILNAARSDKHRLALQIIQSAASFNLLIFWWHSRHIAIDESPRTDTTPGLGYCVEQPEHVGIKLLASLQSALNTYLPLGRNESLGTSRATVSRKYPQAPPHFLFFAASPWEHVNGSASVEI